MPGRGTKGGGAVSLVWRHADCKHAGNTDEAARVVVPLECGDVAVFCSSHRLERRVHTAVDSDAKHSVVVPLRHGMQEVHDGVRFGFGMIFNLAQ
ncbi:hypothetical protein CYMTET_7164 [Cymbomonas tetramitiformis]|uniref:Uncharacterized protein n=1 Tax=Cymbomonas tetramitiformis TaxID=36881 RepID=A0AAE0GVJ1_9CHLO|nr:hypothetical protein CYMTET_7164 [Cymbomonas tetramitiformis]